MWSHTFSEYRLITILILALMIELFFAIKPCHYSSIWKKATIKWSQPINITYKIRFSPLTGDLLGNAILPTNAINGSGWCIFVYNLAPETEENVLWQVSRSCIEPIDLASLLNNDTKTIFSSFSVHLVPFKVSKLSKICKPTNVKALALSLWQIMMRP